jgi:diphosphomevalonate decarboxylase
MTTKTARAIAHPNIAFIKYWGNRDPELRLASNGSISLTLGGLETQTSVTFDEGFSSDHIYVDGQPASPSACERVSLHLDRIRQITGITTYATVESHNNFPVGAGLASSASAFAALSLAGISAAGHSLEPIELSRLARRGSGSACRSIFGGFVEWYASETDEGSYAEAFATPDHWDLQDLIVIFSSEHKGVGSTQGHTLADTSPLQSARVADTPRRLDECRRAILDHDFSALASIIELDCNLMHAVMYTSTPPLIYWHPETLRVMTAVTEWRAEGHEVCYTIDAGPNVHCICTSDHADTIEERLRRLSGVEKILRAYPGDSARVLPSS